MRLDTGNRSFALLLGLALALYLALSVAACALLSLLLYRVATEGTGPLDDATWVTVPAGIFLVSLAAAGVLGVRSLGAQIASSRGLARRIARLSRWPPAEVAEAGAAAGLRHRVRVIEAAEPFSFTYGALRPRVVISRALLDSTSAAELEAVLVHERYHVRNLDPLKVVVARTLASGFFFLPALRQLERRYVAGRELAADKRAVSRCGRIPLASALLKAVRGPAWPELSSAAAIGGPDLLEVRVAQLEAGGEPSLGPFPRRALMLSGAGLGLLVISFAAALAGLGGLSEALEVSDGQLEASGAGPAMVIGCATPWVVGSWLAWRWFRA